MDEKVLYERDCDIVERGGEVVSLEAEMDLLDDRYFPGLPPFGRRSNPQIFTTMIHLPRVSSDRENREVAGKSNDPGKKTGNFRKFRKKEENPGIFIDLYYF